MKSEIASGNCSISRGKMTCKFVLKLVLIFESLMQLSNSNAFFGPYLLVYALGLIASIFIYNSEMQVSGGTSLSDRLRRLCNIAAAFFTALVSAANYPIWLEFTLGPGTPAIIRAVYGFVMFIAVSGGCFFVFHSIFCYISLRPDALAWKETIRPKTGIWKPKNLFLLSFCLIAFVYWFVLFLIKYPGLVEADTVGQFIECMTDRYTNYNPLFSTLVIKPFVEVGMALFGNINACSAMYFAAQSLFVAFAFACVVKTLVEMKAPAWILICTVLFYALMPYHIMFSIGHSKDVLFSVSITLFCLVLYRLLKDPNAPGRYYFYLFAASAGFCLMRNNGILAFAFFIPLYVLAFKKENKRILVILLLAALLCILIKRPLLNALEIPQSDIFESLSLPTQQIARVVLDHNDLTPAEFEILNRIMTVSEIPQAYTAGLSDPIKTLIRATVRDNPVTTQQVLDFAKLWLRLGLRHPVTYVKAFIDLTCGYWNSGYGLVPWCNFIYKNDIGLSLTNPVPVLNMLFDRYIGAYFDFGICQLTISTGLFVWAHMFSAVICLIRKDKVGVIVCMPVLCVVQTLILGVPVFCDLRYIYCAFCGLPLALALATHPRGDDSPALTQNVTQDETC